MQNKPEGGFSLIEVLVAVFVLAIGVLGTAGAQLAALQTRHHSGLMSEGVHLAASLAERMRANVSPGAYVFDYDALTDGPPSPPGVMCFAGASCDSGSMAAFDVYELKKAVHAHFPGGRIKVCRDGGASALSWQCGGGAGAPLVVKLGWRVRSDDPRADAGFVPFVAIPAGGAQS